MWFEELVETKDGMETCSIKRLIPKRVNNFRDLLWHSSQDNPEDLVYGNDSDIAEAIQIEIIRKVDTIKSKISKN